MKLCIHVFYKEKKCSCNKIIVTVFIRVMGMPLGIHQLPFGTFVLALWFSPHCLEQTLWHLYILPPPLHVYI